MTIFDQHVLALAARQTENHQLKALALLFSWRTGKSLDYFLVGYINFQLAARATGFWSGMFQLYPNWTWRAGDWSLGLKGRPAQ